MRIVKSSLALVLILTATSFAQERKWAIGPHLMFSFPQGKFSDVSDIGEGIGGKILDRIFASNLVNARLDLSYVSYGDKRSSDIFGYLVTTRNESFQLTVGPQLNVSSGLLGFYLAPMGGIFNYRVVTSDEYASYIYGYPVTETQESKTKLGWNISGGVAADIGLGPLIDVGFKYQSINDAVTVKTEEDSYKTDAKDFVVTVGVIFYLKND
jgi:hypothetical protein